MLSLNNGWIVVIEPSTNAIVVSSSYSMVGRINHLANCQNEGVTEVLSSVYKIMYTERNEDEPYAACTYECHMGYIKHTAWPAPVPPMH